MEDQHGFYQEQNGDTLPGPGAKKRANGDLKGREMGSAHSGAKRAVIYLRVASAHDASQQQLEQQEASCREVAARLGFAVIAEYHDVGAAPWPGLRQLLGQLHRTRPTCAITLNPSRFGRRYQENMATMAKLAAANVDLVFAENSSGQSHGLLRTTLSKAISMPFISKGVAR